MEIASVLGMHAVTSAVPILAELARNVSPISEGSRLPSSLRSGLISNVNDLTCGNLTNCTVGTEPARVAGEGRTVGCLRRHHHAQREDAVAAWHQAV